MKKNGKKTDPTNKDVISEIKGEFERHTNILMEQMRHEIKTVAEGHGSIIRKLEEHDKRFDKVDAKLTEHDKKFAKVESELQSISMAVMETSQTVKSIEKKLDNHETRITKIETKVLV